MLTNHRDQISLYFDNVTAGYKKPVPVLEGLSLRIKDPGLYQVAGSNGSGKSTLLEMISGFLEPWTGSVSLCGQEAGSVGARDLRSVCRTTPALYPSMTVRDHLAFAALTRGMERETARQRTAAYGLDDWIEQPASSLSTGNQRKLWILMCTLADTPVMVLDEPFNGMDRRGIETLVHELQEWAATRIVLLISHTVPASLYVEHSFVLQRELQSRST